jgi:magnesium transporter
MSTTDLNENILEDIKLLISQQNEDELRLVVERLFPQDIAELFDDLDLEDAIYLTSFCNSNKRVDIVKELSPSLRKRFFEGYTIKDIAEFFLQYMDSDDAADVLNELSNDHTNELLAKIPDKEHSKNIAALLKFPDDIAGGLMAKELIKVNVDWNIKECTEEIRKQAEDVENVYTIYVVNNFGELVGRISMKAILLAQESAEVKDIYTDNLIYENTYTTAEDVANTMQKYNLVALPIVDAFNRLVGRITVDDIIDYVKEEADKDYQMLSGISSSKDSSDDTIFGHSRSRLPWLMIGLFGGIANSVVIGGFEESLSRNVQLALFMPLIMAMAGNVGVQSSSIVVQGLANNMIDEKRIFGRISKELSIALINGLICAFVLLTYGLIFNRATQEIMITVSLTLLSVILIAGVVGTLVPMILNKFNVDPAIATGPFITTSNDLLGMMVYFLIASLILGMF